jgi:two-component system, LytTR family, response regulator
MEQMLNALIIDDEENARILLNKLLEETLLFKNIRLASSVDSAYNELNLFEPDIIFLDIKMPGKDGFAFIQELPQKYKMYKIVFVTAYDQYAIKAIKSQAFDYLLKPVNRKELKQCLQRVIDRKNNDTDKGGTLKIIKTNERITRIRVNTRTGTLFINPDDILYCKAEGNYTAVCTGKKQHLCSMNLGKVAELLPKNGFIRIGRSYIINFEHITMLDRKECTISLVREGETATIKIPRQHIKDLDIL